MGLPTIYIDLGLLETVLEQSFTVNSEQTLASEIADNVNPKWIQRDLAIDRGLLDGVRRFGHFWPFLLLLSG